MFILLWASFFKLSKKKLGQIIVQFFYKILLVFQIPSCDTFGIQDIYTYICDLCIYFISCSYITFANCTHAFLSHGFINLKFYFSLAIWNVYIFFDETIIINFLVNFNKDISITVLNIKNSKCLSEIQKKVCSTFNFIARA